MDTYSRFWSKVRKPSGVDGCWEWTGARIGNGYGETWLNKKPFLAHRASVLISGREIPPGAVVDHLCNNKTCVRPDHLAVTTHRVNILRSQSAAAQNARKTACPSGHPYDEVNTWRDKNGNRFCRACRRLYVNRNRAAIQAMDRARYARKKSRGNHADV